MYKLNFNHLYYFLTISHEGSIVKASKKLNMTQPALSHQLKSLEEDLGKKLFDRIGKKLVINSDGEAVKEYASKIFRHSEEMMEYLKSENNQYTKIVKIGTVSWISKDLIYDFIRPLLFSPFIKIEVHQTDLDTLISDIQNNKLDLILCDSPYSGRSQKLQEHRLKLDPIVCVAASKSGIRGKFPKSIMGKKAISYSEACLISDKIESYLTGHNIEVKTIGAFSDTSLIKVAVERGGVIGFLPQSVVKQSLKEKKLVKLGVLSDVKFSLWAITHKNYSKNGVIASLLQ